ncbi:thioredoxin family protein [Sungkyunkwania multivorans]|uniref:Thioredoxin family protein n=1 Tax=Sungkyunkwania multivorans TaxID=1173618 RepID=A0ABW3CV84_9FLAO
MKTIKLTMLMMACYSVSFAQYMNKEILNKKGTPYLIGEINKEGLQRTAYASWFNKNYDEYEVDATAIESFMNDIKEMNILVFMGTWCGDSKREVPRLYKILAEANFPMDQLKVVAVDNRADHYKQSPSHEEKGLNIHRVPTIIFYDKGKEVNRIVERPVNSLEKDISSILNTDEYTPNYKVVAQLHQLFSRKNMRYLRRKREKLAARFKDEVANVYELNTYGRVLVTSGKDEKATFVYELNMELFPEDAIAHFSLGKIYEATDQMKALSFYQNAHSLLPDNQKIKQALEKLQAQMSAN